MSQATPAISCLSCGHYLLKNAADSPVTLRRQQADGESVGPVSGVALCRCGGSRNKPYCDGSHWKIGFSDDSDWARGGSIPRGGSRGSAIASAARSPRQRGPEQADLRYHVGQRGDAMTSDDKQSPQIEQISWGHIRIAGIGSGKDFKLWPGGGREWDWNETGTRHEPGIQPADIEELLDRGCRVIVLSRGMLLRLRTCEETLALIESRGARVLVAETREAVRLYNDLAASGEAVGGLFHSTC